jgi:hypothetical protein
MIAVYIFFENQKNKQKIAELKEDKLKLILDSLKQNTTLSEDVKHQLEKLIHEFADIDEGVSNELAEALQLLQIGQTENAIEDLVKIIEHLLTVHYNGDDKFISWLTNNKKKQDLHTLLMFCKEEKKITDIEFKFFIAIKTLEIKKIIHLI